MSPSIGSVLDGQALVVAGPAHAGAKGRRNTAAALGAAAAYEAVQGRGTNALILGAGAVGAYGRYRDARDEERYDDWRDRYRDRDHWHRFEDRRYDSRPRRHRERVRYGRYDADERCDDREYSRSRRHRGYYLERD
jgi:hypothetical protein